MVAGSFALRAARCGLSDDLDQEAELSALRFARRRRGRCSETEFRERAGRHVKTQLVRFLDHEERMVAVDSEELEHAAERAMGEQENFDPVPYDPFFSATVGELKARHNEWEAERAARWADIRNGDAAENAVAA